ncbi:MAG: TerB family tellurite resistance protein [Candidatus Marinamargulisbacteria bacterium]
MHYQRYSNGGNYFWLLFLVLLMFGGFRTIFLLFGLVIAFLINFFPLIIAGFFVYRFVKRVGHNRFVNASLTMKSDDFKRFVEIMVHILMHIAKADGNVSQSEIQVIRQFFISQMQFSGGKLAWLNDVIEAAQQSTESLTALTQEFTRQFGYESQLMLLNMVYNVAYSDGEFHEAEGKIIDRLANALNLSAFDHQRIKMAFEAQFGDIAKQANDNKYYAILGLTNSANKDEIKKSYRQLTKKYHPDKVQHLGEEFRVQAEKKMQEINHAYDELMKRVAA